jgi:hypothetical protein
LPELVIIVQATGRCILKYYIQRRRNKISLLALAIGLAILCMSHKSMSGVEYTLKPERAKSLRQSIFPVMFNDNESSLSQENMQILQSVESSNRPISIVSCETEEADLDDKRALIVGYYLQSKGVKANIVSLRVEPCAGDHVIGSDAYVSNQIIRLVLFDKHKLISI